MIANLKPYPEHKESGLPWLGQVPGHWSVSRIKTVLRETDCRATDSSGTLLSLTRVRGLIPHRDMTDKMHSAKTLVGYKRYCAGQLVMNRMQAWSGMFGAGAMDGLVSPDYAVFDVLGGHAIKLVLERLKTPDLVAQFALESKGIGSGFNRLYTDRFGPIPISLPPPDEQAAIVQFLDWANGRLERAIRAKRKVIALLNEQKQAIIHRAVTRGLDSSVPLKPSGIPWLGDIPQHWEMKRLKAIAQIRYGLGQPPRESETGLPLIRATNVDQGRILEKNMVRVDPADVPKTRNAFLKAGEIIVVRSGALTADSAIIPKEYEGAVAGYDMVVTVKTSRAEFIAMALLSSYVQSDQLVIASMRAAQPHLNAEELGTAILLLPPDEEQKQLVEFVRNEISPIDIAISRLKREIDLLREYRTRLVADVVTGKLDVRESAALLPDEISDKDGREPAVEDSLDVNGVEAREPLSEEEE